MKRPKNTPMEALILKLTQHLSFSVGELIGFVDPSSLPELPSLTPMPVSADAYSIDEADSPEYIEPAALNHVHYPVLEGIANLYLKKQIIFQR